MCAKDCNETDSRSPRNAAGSTFILTRRAQRGGRRRETGDPALPLVTPVSAPPVPRSPGPGRVCRTGEAGKWVRTGRGGRGGRRGLTCRRTAGAPSPPPRRQTRRSPPVGGFHAAGLDDASFPQPGLPGSDYFKLPSFSLCGYRLPFQLFACGDGFFTKEGAGSASPRSTGESDLTYP